MGVKLRLVQYPCKSGWPSGVRGMTQDFLLVVAFVSVLVAVFVLAPDCAWAVVNVGAHRTAAITTAKALNENQNRFLILDLLRFSTCWSP